MLKEDMATKYVRHIGVKAWGPGLYKYKGTLFNLSDKIYISSIESNSNGKYFITLITMNLD